MYSSSGVDGVVDEKVVLVVAAVILEGAREVENIFNLAGLVVVFVVVGTEDASVDVVVVVVVVVVVFFLLQSTFCV